MLRIYLRHQPVFNVLLGAFSISFSAVFVQLAEVPPSTSAFYRVFFGAIFLAICAVATREWQKMKVLSWILCIGTGLIFAIDLFVWHKAIILIGPGLATLLASFQVFVLAGAGALLFQERLLPKLLVALPLSILGLSLIVGPDWNNLGPDYRLGIFFGLLTALFYSIYLLLLRQIQTIHQNSLFFVLLVVSAFSAIFLAAHMSWSGISFAIPDVKSLSALVGLGLVSQTLGWALIAKSMPKIRASLTGLVLLLQPTLSFIWDVLFFDRHTDLINWAGVILTVTAIYMGSTGKKRDR